MAITILKNQSGQVWKDLTGNVIKDKPFNEQLLTNGLVGLFDADHINNVGGYCQAMINQVVGGQNMIQNTASSQLQVYQDVQNGKNAIGCNIPHTQRFLTPESTPFTGIKQVFAVIDLNADYVTGIFDSFPDMYPSLGSYGGYYQIHNQYGFNPCYFNSNIVTAYSQTRYTEGAKIIVPIDNYDTTINKFGSIVRDGVTTTNYERFFALALYNRVLSPDEIRYNILALRTIYGI